MRAITGKDEDLLSHFENINEGKITAEIKDIIKCTSLKEMLIGDHADAKKVNTRGQSRLEHIFGFCKTFKKITKSLGFHLTFKTANLQDNIYTRLA